MRSISVLAIAACTAHSPPPREINPEPAALPPTVERDHARTRYHMRQQIADLDGIVDAIVDNRLAEARALAFGLTLDAEPFTETARSAHALSRATTVDDASRLAARLSASCASCHAGWMPHREQVAPSIDESTLRGHMQRNRWALRRARDAMMTATVAGWRSALEILAADPFPGRDPKTARALQRLARERLDHVGTDSVDERIAAYGTILATCAQCHARPR